MGGLGSTGTTRAIKEKIDPLRGGRDNEVVTKARFRACNSLDDERVHKGSFLYVVFPLDWESVLEANEF